MTESTRRTVPPPPTPPPPNLAYTSPEAPPAPDPLPQPDAPTKRKGRPRGSKNKPKEAAPPPVEAMEPDDLRAMVTAQASQISSLMAMMANQAPTEQVDGSITPFEREKQAAKKAQLACRMRTPERDADPTIRWMGSHYCKVQSAPGFIPVHLVKELVPGAPYTVPSAPKAQATVDSIPASMMTPGPAPATDQE